MLTSEEFILIPSIHRLHKNARDSLLKGPSQPQLVVVVGFFFTSGDAIN